MSIDSIRRVVVGSGSPAAFRDDSPGATPITMSENVSLAELWATSEAKPPAAGYIDCTPDRAIVPAPGHSALRVIEFRPGFVAEQGFNKVLDQILETSGNSAGHLHRTRTMDFFAVLGGELHLVTPSTETRLTAGDYAICLGVDHGWENRSTTNAHLLTIMLGTRDFGEGAALAGQVGSATGQSASDGGSRLVVAGPTAGGDHEAVIDLRVPRIPTDGGTIAEFWGHGQDAGDRTQTWNALEAHPSATSERHAARFCSLEIAPSSRSSVLGGAGIADWNDHVLSYVVPIGGMVSCSSPRGDSTLRKGDVLIHSGPIPTLCNVGEDDATVAVILTSRSGGLGPTVL